MGLFDGLTNIDEILKSGLNSMITELRVLNSKFSSDTNTDIIINPTDTSKIENLLVDIGTTLRDTESEINIVENRVYNIEKILDTISTSLVSSPINGIYPTDDSIGTNTETVVLEGKDIPSDSIVTVELPTPFGGIITNIQVVGHEKLVNMELYLGGNRKFPYSTGGFFPSEVMSFDTHIPVIGGQVIKGRFSNGDNNLQHTVQVYITIKN